MKHILTSVLTLLLLFPVTVVATTTIPWVASSTPASYVQPTLINGVSPALYIQSNNPNYFSGTVGIGTNNPASISNLPIVVNSANLSGLYLNTTSNGAGYFSHTNGNMYLVNLTGSQLVVSSGSGDLSFWTGGINNERMRILTSNGNVGIASSTPWAKLSVGTGNGSSTAAILSTEHQPATSTSMTLNWRDGNTQLIRIGTAAITIAHSGYVPGQRLTVTICNPGTGTAGAITWSGVNFGAAGTPTQVTTAQKCQDYPFQATAGTSTMFVKGLGVTTSY